MSTDRTNEADNEGSVRSDDAMPGLPGVGNDERENREHIAESGEPQRDALGNADGAS
jgi:hypothetical protein